MRDLNATLQYCLSLSLPLIFFSSEISSGEEAGSPPSQKTREWKYYVHAWRGGCCYRSSLCKVLQWHRGLRARQQLPVHSLGWPLAGNLFLGSCFHFSHKTSCLQPRGVCLGKTGRMPSAGLGGAVLELPPSPRVCSSVCVEKGGFLGMTCQHHRYSYNKDSG